MQLRLPPRSAGPRTQSPRSISSDRPLAITSGCSRPTSRRASTRSTTPPFMGRSATSDRGQTRPGPGEGVLARPGSSPRMASDRDTITGTPQGGILSPLLANIALSVLDEHFTRKWEALGPDMEARQASRRRCHRPIASSATRTISWSWSTAPASDAEALRDEVTSRCSLRSGLRLSEEKTRVCHIDEGFDFLGWRIQRRSPARSEPARGRSTPTHPRRRLASVMDKVRSLTRRAEASNARRPAARGQPSATGMVQLLPPRRVRADLQLPATTSRGGGLSAGSANDTHGLNWGIVAAAYLPDGRSATGQIETVPATSGRDRSLPLPGRPHPHTMGRTMRTCNLVESRMR